VREGKQFDLILMDIIMPNLDGISATHFIRSASQSVPIIAMTSNIRSDDLVLYYTHGMNDILPKPFTRESLLHLLEKHLGHLKKNNGLEGHTLVGGVLPRIKDEGHGIESPQKTPVGSSSAGLGGGLGGGSAAWNSSPGGSTVQMSAASLSPDLDYASMGHQPVGGTTGFGGIPTTPTGLHHFTGAGGTQLVGQRRGIAEISGGEDAGSVAKRQQQQQQMYGMGMQQSSLGRR
jgi:osomolarity two-component system, response regulator SKN7